MAGRNGTGPMGLGMMTGRGLGNCNPNNEGFVPNVVGARLGLGRGRGRGRGLGQGNGFGLGQGNGFGRQQGFRNAWRQETDVDSLEALQMQAKMLEANLANLNQRILDLTK